MKKIGLVLLVGLGFAGALSAAEPPESMNYQGVLRDSIDAPINGTESMVFRFYDVSTGGTALLEETHSVVEVSNGLFNVRLGTGTISAGPLYTSLADLFADESELYLGVKVGTDAEMTPRIPLDATAWALNAGRLDGRDADTFADSVHGHPGADITGQVGDADTVDGKHASEFLDTSSTPQTKEGALALTNVSPGSESSAVELVPSEFTAADLDCEVIEYSPSGTPYPTRASATFADCLGETGARITTMRTSPAGANPVFDAAANLALSSGEGGQFIGQELDAGHQPITRVTVDLAVPGDTEYPDELPPFGGKFELNADDCSGGFCVLTGAACDAENPCPDPEAIAKLALKDDDENYGIWATGTDYAGYFDGRVKVDRLSLNFGVDPDFPQVRYSNADLAPDATRAGNLTCAYSRLGGQNPHEYTGSAIVELADCLFEEEELAAHLAAESNRPGELSERTEAIVDLASATGVAGLFIGRTLLFDEEQARASVELANINNGIGVNASGESYAGYFDGKVYVSNRLGVGTTSPDYELSVEGAIESKGQAGGYRFPDGSWQLSAAVPHGLRPVSGSTDLEVFVDAQGEVGIGTLAPEQKLHVQGGNVAGLFESALTGVAYVGDWNKGISAGGSVKGGWFADDLFAPNVEASLAYTNSGRKYGVWGHSNYTGGYFEAGFARAWVGASGVYDETAGSYIGDDWGVYAVGGGPQGGGGVHGEDRNSGTYGRLGWAGVTIGGNGAKPFIQNHPRDRESVIVYAALEGDEVATYTRGTARLFDGEARVMLDETFKWVTNPDIGLTAQITPRGAWADLYVASVSTEELVVRSRDGEASVTFDFVVHGLRIGFEEFGIVRKKDREAPIPLLASNRERQEKGTAPNDYTALARFAEMQRELGLTATPDLTASEALKASIGVYEPAVRNRILAEKPNPAETVAGDMSPTEGASRTSIARPDGPGRGILPVDDEGNVYGRSFRPSAADLASLVKVSEPVEAGDVLAIDAESPGLMSLARVPADTAVFGIVASEPGVVLGATPKERIPASETGRRADVGTSRLEQPDRQLVSDVPVALSGLVRCKVDAGYGAIRAGDLLTTSPTVGHAMRTDEPQPGTILGKALEPLDSGTGTIKILVMLR